MFRLIKKEKHSKGSFNEGEILENKPIGFQQDGGEVKPYSNLFYWAHAWTPGKKSTIGLHPHRGFEICSFVLKGKIRHFDNKQNKWIPLNEGDVQIIRAGSGISHAEEIEAKSEIFQIWFNPDLSKSLKSEASYNDYKNENFPVESKYNFLKKTIKGKNSPINMETENIEIYEYEIQTGKIEISTNKNFTHSFFLLKGKVKINDFWMTKSDFAIINDSEKIKINSLSNSKIFEIKSPTNPSYATYF
jgi:redox-sensitive bicupin YhaK (pirin superfamily)